MKKPLSADTRRNMSRDWILFQHLISGYVTFATVASHVYYNAAYTKASEMMESMTDEYIFGSMSVHLPLP